MIMSSLPPVAEVRCIKPEDAGSVKLASRIVVSGDEKAVQTWLISAAAKGVSKIDSDHRESGKREVIVLLPSNTAYRTIGAVIYSGQSNGLATTIKTEPPICGEEVSPAEDNQPTQQRLDALSDQCGTPHEWLTNVGGKRVRIRPSPDAKYEAVDCMLQKLKASKLDMDLGFIGNEADLPKAKHK